MQGRAAALILAAVALGAAQPATNPIDDADLARRVKAHVTFLASDLMEGRETGSRGLEVAAAYVASQFEQMGLKPGGPGGSWYQQVPFRRAYHATPPRITYTVGGKAIPIEVGRDAGVRPSLTEQVRSVDAGLVFAGRGISDPVLDIDDYAGIDARGKIVVVLAGTPAGLPSDIASHLDEVKDDTAAAKGAVGYIEVEADTGSPYESPERHARPLLDWRSPEGRTGAQTGPIGMRISVSPAMAERLFEGSAMRLAAVRTAAQRGDPVRGFALPGQMQVHAESRWEDFSSPQVVAIMPGSDPALAGEHIVLMGHLDHHGLVDDAPAGADRVNNGAIDNASGIATMIEAARKFTGPGQAPKRSLLFLAVTGEEQGLLGADYFAAHPTVPAGSMVGLVNLDMPLLLYDFTDVVAFGSERSSIASAVAVAGQSMGVALTPDPLPEEALFVRSDHYRFVVRGVPSVFLMTGFANGGEQAWRRFLSTVYHKPNDDLAQPISWRAAARFAELNYRIARAMADASERPRWKTGDYFGDSFAPGQPRAPR